MSIIGFVDSQLLGQAGNLDTQVPILVEGGELLTADNTRSDGMKAAAARLDANEHANEAASKVRRR